MRPTRTHLARAAGTALLALAAPAAAWALPAGETVALRAGTVHLVEGGQVLTGGVTVLVVDGKEEARYQHIQSPLVFSPKGDRLALVNRRGGVTVALDGIDI